MTAHARAPGQRPDDAPDGLQNKLRVCRAAPFCWQHKAARRKIRDAFDRDKTVHSALGVYDALTEIASDKESEVFETTHAYIAQLSGWSPRTVQDRLPELEEIKLVEIHTPALKAPSTIRLLAVAVKQPLPNARQRPKRAPLPTLEQEQKKESNKGGTAPPVFEPVERGLFRREYEAMIRDAQTEIQTAKGNPQLRERVLEKSVAEVCEFLRTEAKAKPEKAADNLKRAADLEKDSVNYTAGKFTPAGQR